MWNEVYVGVEHVLYLEPPTYAYEEWIEDIMESVYSALVVLVIFVVMSSEPREHFTTQAPPY